MSSKLSIFKAMTWEESFRQVLFDFGAQLQKFLVLV